MGAGIIIAGESNIGLTRKRNEDNFVLASLPGRVTALAAVADGIGGHRGGDIASRLCCENLGIGYLNAMPGMRLAEDAAQFFRRVLEEVNLDLYRRSCASQLPMPMGSTVIAAIFFAKQMVLVSSGDSHCYEYRPKTGLRQLNTDHVLSPEVLAKLQPEEECQNSGSSPLMQAIGLRERLEIDLEILHRSPDSRYIFCSDGLYRGVPEEKMREILDWSETPRDAVNELMREALMAGGGDNITIIAAFPEKAAGSGHETP